MNQHASVRKLTGLLIAAALTAAVLAACQSPAVQSSAQSGSSEHTSSAATTSAQVSSEPVSSAVSSAPASSKPISSAPASSAPVSSKPASSASASSKPASAQGSTLTLAQETANTGHYNNTVAPFNSNYVTVCGDYALEIIGGSVSKSYANVVTAFADRYPNLRVACAIIPKSSAFNHPSQYANQYSVQKSFIDNTYALMGSRVIKVDAMGEMNSHAGEYMFYRTDHHWTSLGAYYASVAYGNAMDIRTRALADYQTVCTNGYIGSMYTFCATPKPACLTANPDYTVGRLPAASYTMTYTTGGTTYTGTAVNAKNSGYMMFMCGDQAFTDIKTTNATGRKLLIFKESYGNAFAPYMIDYYDEVIVVDIRQSTMATSAIISQYGITDVLIINNIQAANTSAQITSLQGKMTS